MSFDMNSLPDDVEELKRIIIFEKNKILEYQEQLQLQRQKEVEYREELRLQKLKESEHLDQIERLKIQLFGRKTEKWSQIEKDQGLLFNEIESSLREDSPEPEETSLFTPVKSHTRKNLEENRSLNIFLESKFCTIFLRVKRPAPAVIHSHALEKRNPKS
ncbi:IS166 homeodomain transposase C [Leptospira weilii str. UI 13098]|uniref:IS166 homeodomain transposase C n=1 Tax=Leptospira weilii str. UI 13098 TaxID=1088542 RepID=M6QIG9_9LEPT|nr:IS166 homeodomain transposase C [Leptospira weilii str. UI 13098]